MKRKNKAKRNVVISRDVSEMLQVFLQMNYSLFSSGFIEKNNSNFVRSALFVFEKIILKREETPPPHPPVTTNQPASFKTLAGGRSRTGGAVRRFSTAS